MKTGPSSSAPNLSRVLGIGFAVVAGLWLVFRRLDRDRLPVWLLPSWPAAARWVVLVAGLYFAGRVLVFLFDRLQFARGVYDPFAWVRGRQSWLGRWWDRWQAHREIKRKFGGGPTGRWEDERVIWRRGLREGDIFLGRLPGTLWPVGIGTERHMVTIGQMGSGKSTGVMVPNLCFHRGSVLCIDPKGELAEITAARRGQGGDGVRGLGQEVYVLDPFGTVSNAKSASYNVFEEMARVAEKDQDRPVSYAGKIAEALVKMESKREPYFDNAARTIIRGLVLYIFEGAPEKRNLVELRRLLMEGDVEEWKKQPADVQGKMTPFEMLFEKMRRVPEGPYRDTIAGAAGSVLGMGPNQLGSVLSTAQEHTTFLDSPEIRRLSMGSDFLLDDLKRKGMSVYLCLPINMISGKEGRWLRMFVTMFVDIMMREKTRPQEPVLLAIDEFPNLGRIESIETSAATMRSYGGRMLMAGQDIMQFRAAYPDTWNTIIGGAEAVQLLGVTEPETVNYISKLLGQHVVAVQAGGRTIRQERPLLDPEQVGRVLWPELKNQIVWRGSRKPMKLKVTPYYEYLPAWYYSADPRYPEASKRRKFRRAELKAEQSEAA